MVPAGNKAKCLSSVNHTTEKIHHPHHHHHLHHHYHHHQMQLQQFLFCMLMKTFQKFHIQYHFADCSRNLCDRTCTRRHTHAGKITFPIYCTRKIIVISLFVFVLFYKYTYISNTHRHTQTHTHIYIYIFLIFLCFYVLKPRQLSLFWKFTEVNAQKFIGI